MTMPLVNSPRITSSTPRASTARLARVVITDGSVPRKRFSRVNRTLWVLTLAWYPAHWPKKPFSAPLALMVSIIRMPLMVLADSLAASRCCTRVMFTRLAVIRELTPMFRKMALTPIRAMTQLYRIITTR